MCASGLTESSDQLAYSIFRCNWMEQTKVFKMSMLIFTEKCIKPIVPMAGGLFEIGLPRFLSVRLWRSGFYFVEKINNYNIFTDNEDSILVANLC